MTDFNQNFDRELNWEDEITVDGSSFIELEPGDYQFTVTNFERARHTPNPQNPGKLPACNKAIVTISIETEEGSKSMKHNLFLHSSTEGMLSAFFGAIGQKKHGEPLRMNWNNIIGAKGVARIGKRQGTGNYADQKFDDIKSMVYADEVDWTKVLNANVQPSVPQVPVTPQQPYQQPQQAMPQAPVQPQAPQQGSFFEGNTTTIPPQQAMPQQPQPQAPTSGGFGGF